jgi:pyruvate dehydrogenase E2 component (dihydrolipoamide acetyltransferase)
MARFVFTVPDLGEGLIDLTVREWLVAVGDSVERNAPIAEVETTKSAVELPSPVAGIVKELHAKVDEAVDVGTPLVTFEVADEAGIVGAVPSDEKPSRRVRLRPPGTP